VSGYVWRGTPPPPPPPVINPCSCGCGEEAPIATKTDRRIGAVRGQPQRYIKGHNPPGGSFRRSAQHPP
jgi:hypothetical protein